MGKPKDKIKGSSSPSPSPARNNTPIPASPLSTPSFSQAAIDTLITTKTFSISSVNSACLARINSETMNLLNISPASFISLTSSSSTVVLRCFSDPSVPFSHLKIDEDSFRDLNGSTATLSTTSIPSSLSSLSLSLLKPNIVLNKVITSLLKSKLIGRVVSLSSTVSVSCPPFLESHDMIKVIKFDCLLDSEFGLVTPETLINISTENLESNPSDSKFFGYQTLQSSLSNLIELSLLHSFLFNQLSFPPPKSILIYGPSGTGKKSLIKSCLKKLKEKAEFNVIEVVGSQEEIKRRLEGVNFNQSDIVILPNIESHFQAPQSSQSDSSFSLSSFLNTINSSPNGPLFISSCSSLDSLPPNIRSKFVHEVELYVPSPSDRYDILDGFLSCSCSNVSTFELEQFAYSLHGYVGRDLLSILKLAVLSAVSEFSKHPSHSPLLTISHLKASSLMVRPSALREVTLSIPTTKWEDVGGLEKVKQLMKEAVEWPIKFPHKFSALGITPSKGVLLYGPPGCSKTLIAKALATEAGLNFLVVKGPELFSKYLGESEKSVRSLFAKARAASPSIIFFDEIDALAVNRDGNGSGAGERVLASILNEMDGIENLSNVIVVAATNRPDLIDSALIRPGRLDRLIYMGLPEFESRIEILKVGTRKTPLSDDVIIRTLAEKTDGFSAAEITCLCREAALNVLREDIEKGEVVRMKHFEMAFEVVKPQITREMIDFYRNFEEKSRR
ncbi:hypothetical protein RCL1_007199 [Eukaryota sp. TZLM3-RCL]